MKAGGFTMQLKKGAKYGIISTYWKIMETILGGKMGKIQQIHGNTKPYASPETLWKLFMDYYEKYILGKDIDDSDNPNAMFIDKDTPLPSVEEFMLYIGSSPQQFGHKRTEEDLIDVCDRIELVCSVKAAKLLLKRTNVTGIIFYLKNKFNWSDKREAINTTRIEEKVSEKSSKELKKEVWKILQEEGLAVNDIEDADKIYDFGRKKYGG